MRLPVAASLVLAFAGCAGARSAAIDQAIAGMQDQVAADIALTADPADATAYYQSDETVRYAVCGVAELHRPSNLPEMNLDRSRQRYVAFVYRSGQTMTTFEGRQPSPEFQVVWNQRCR